MNDIKRTLDLITQYEQLSEAPIKLPSRPTRVPSRPGGGAEPSIGAPEAPITPPKPKITVRPGETMDDAIRRTRTERSTETPPIPSATGKSPTAVPPAATGKQPEPTPPGVTWKNEPKYGEFGDYYIDPSTRKRIYSYSPDERRHAAQMQWIKANPGKAIGLGAAGAAGVAGYSSLLGYRGAKELEKYGLIPPGTTDKAIKDKFSMVQPAVDTTGTYGKGAYDLIKDLTPGQIAGALGGGYLGKGLIGKAIGAGVGAYGGGAAEKALKGDQANTEPQKPDSVKSYQPKAEAPPAEPPRRVLQLPPPAEPPKPTPQELGRELRPRLGSDINESNAVTKILQNYKNYLSDL